jgi:hypothetical protein
MPLGEFGQLVCRSVGHSQHRRPLLGEAAGKQGHFAGVARRDHKDGLGHGHSEGRQVGGGETTATGGCGRG